MVCKIRKWNEIKGFGAEEMIDICNKNAERFFGFETT